MVGIRMVHERFGMGCCSCWVTSVTDVGLPGCVGLVTHRVSPIGVHRGRTWQNSFTHALFDVHVRFVCVFFVFCPCLGAWARKSRHVSPYVEGHGLSVPRVCSSPVWFSMLIRNGTPQHISGSESGSRNHTMHLPRHTSPCYDTLFVGSVRTDLFFSQTRSSRYFAIWPIPCLNKV